MREVKYRGRMKTSFLNDRQVRPIEYSRWVDAVRHFGRHERDRVKVEELKASIREKGLLKPILLGVSARYPEDVYVGDGHHRAVALMALGVESFDFYWYWIKSFGVRMERDPFPFHLL
ncbi:ParB/Srx family N-terminal domain-containing protein [Streptomyces syringium]|uniref:ParB/Srx family N-terminal domain-containing protein n=1 Tax=Streptomyces syringium TaxID=76729 RepID=UPI0034549165